DKQAEILVASRERKCQRFVCEETIENDQVLRRGIAFFRVQQDRAFSEQNVRGAIEHSLNSLVVTVDRNNSGIQFEFIQLAAKPLQSCCSRYSREGPILQSQANRATP